MTTLAAVGLIVLAVRQPLRALVIHAGLWLDERGEW